MTDATDLWASVESHYDANTLTQLTNVKDVTATSADDTHGALVAQEFIDLFPQYAETDYDASDTTHVAIGRHGVVALLRKYRGSTSEVAQRDWDEVFGTDGMLVRLKLTNARAHGVPQSNSDTTRTAETSGGRNTKDWSDPDTLPGGSSFLPSRETAR